MSELPAATPGQIAQASKICSELHHGYYTRPSTAPADDKNRRIWEYFYIRKIHSLTKLLTEARYEQLPPLAIACIYQSNIVAARQRYSTVPVKIDLEAIHPEGRDMPNLDPGKDMRPLRYEPTNSGQVPLQEFNKEYRDWWRIEGTYQYRWISVAGTYFVIPSAVKAMQEKQKGAATTPTAAVQVPTPVTATVGSSDGAGGPPRCVHACPFQSVLY